jgi:hypothetical protein
VHATGIDAETPAAVLSPTAAAAAAAAGPTSTVLYTSSQSLVTFLQLLPNLRTKCMYKLRTYTDSFRGAAPAPACACVVRALTRFCAQHASCSTCWSSKRSLATATTVRGAVACAPRRARIVVVLTPATFTHTHTHAHTRSIAGGTKAGGRAPDLAC